MSEREDGRQAGAVTRTYGNGEVTVVWKRDLCVHSGRCFQGLPQVFDPRRRPWVDVEAAATDAIVEQVSRCPSGALSYVRDAGKAAASFGGGAPPPAPPGARGVGSADLAAAAAVVAGALPAPTPSPAPVERLVQVAANGPLIVPWALSVRFPDGRVEKRPPAGTAFCRCGHSGNKPYCDGSHNKAGFVG